MDFGFLFFVFGFFPKGSLREVFFAEDKIRVLGGTLASRASANGWV